MRVRAIGVIGMQGKGKQSGNDYNFAQLKVLVPVEIVANANMRKTGFGLEAQDVDIRPELLNKFAAVPSWPAELDLVTEQQIDRHGIKTVVVDFKIPVAIAARAA